MRVEEEARISIWWHRDHVQKKNTGISRLWISNSHFEKMESNFKNPRYGFFAEYPQLTSTLEFSKNSNRGNI